MAGKPKKPTLVKTYTLRIRMTDEERQLLEEAARLRSLETSTWARSELVAMARVQLDSGGAPAGAGRPAKKKSGSGTG